MAKKIEDILKEIEELYKEAKDNDSKLLDEAAEAEDGIKKFTEIGGELINYTVNNINKVAPWVMIAQTLIPNFLKPYLIPAITASAVGGSALVAPWDYASDHLDLGENTPELVQDIYDYAAAYNEKVQADKENFKYADKYEDDALQQWEDIKNFVDKNGKIENPASRDELKETIDDMNQMVPDANITISDNHIQDYTYLDKTMYNRIKKESIKKRKSNLQDSQDEADYYLGVITEMYQNALDKRNHAYGDYQEKVKRYNMAIANYNRDATFGPSENFFQLLVEKQEAEKKFAKAYLEFGAISELKTSYETVDEINKNLSTQESELDKAIAQVEYEINYPDARKTFAQLEGEAYAKRESEKCKELKANSEHESKYLDAGKPFAQLEGEAYAKRMKEQHSTESTAKQDQPYQTNIIIPDEKPYSNEQPVSDTVQNNIYTQETTELTNNIIDDYIEQLRTLPEEMRNMGQQSRDAFIEGLLDGDDEHFGERIAEATLKIANMFSDNMGESFYQSGGESAIKFIEGFEDELERSYERIMANRSLNVEGITAGQQMASFNYYQNAPQASSKPEKIVLENHADVAVKIDREVLGKTMMQWTKEYERSTGT